MSIANSNKEEESNLGRESDGEGGMGLSEMLEDEERERPRMTSGSPVLSTIRYQGGRLSDRKPSAEMESVREEDHVVTASRRRGSTATTLYSTSATQDENGFDLSYIVSGLEVLGVEKV